MTKTFETNFNLDSYTNQFHGTPTTKFDWIPDSDKMIRVSGYGLGVLTTAGVMVMGANATAELAMSSVNDNIYSKFANVVPTNFADKYPELMEISKVHTVDATVSTKVTYTKTVKNMGENLQKDRTFNETFGKEVLSKVKGLWYTQDNTKIAQGKGLDCSSLVKKFVDASYGVNFPRSADLQYALAKATGKLFKDEHGVIVNGDTYDDLSIIKDIPNNAIVYFSKIVNGKRHVYHTGVKNSKRGDSYLYQAFKSGTRVKNEDMSDYFNGSKRIEGVIIPEKNSFKQADFYAQDGTSLYDLNFKVEYRNRIKYTDGMLGLTTMSGVRV